ncbi:sugar phosphate nucleotidyltransferase [Paenibacillus oleatilyticus]|uniref:sugar phosphate nucleotidyltransferase n=1 Tax=Paenibacillus oleatilyticus TaxID=2594886 RepID=UPI001C1F2264|nr:sugar phosphate nucleotidyltransferase [Paenibacillus oleatilyticus]MBU7314115.1 hypothetical protein [Paenibacillus oleatilyticus]
MIHYAISKLAEAGIRDILLVTGKYSGGLFMDYIGREWNVRISFKVQEEPGGIAQALALAEGFVSLSEKFVVLLGDNLFEDSLTEEFARFREQPEQARVRTVQPSARGEMEITDVNNMYAVRGMLFYGILSGWWIDAGTHLSFREAAQRIAGEVTP